MPTGSSPRPPGAPRAQLWAASRRGGGAAGPARRCHGARALQAWHAPATETCAVCVVMGTGALNSMGASPSFVFAGGPGSGRRLLLQRRRQADAARTESENSLQKRVGPRADGRRARVRAPGRRGAGASASRAKRQLPGGRERRRRASERRKRLDASQRQGKRQRGWRASGWSTLDPAAPGAGGAGARRGWRVLPRGGRCAEGAKQRGRRRRWRGEREGRSGASRDGARRGAPVRTGEAQARQ